MFALSKNEQLKDSSVIFPLIKGYADDYFESIGWSAEVPFVKYLFGLIRGRNIKGLASLSDNEIYQTALHSGDHSTIRFILQVEAFVKKNASIKGVDTKLAALESFKESELKCQATNARLDEVFDSSFFKNSETYVKGETMQASVARMSLDIRSMLGPYGAFERSLPGLVRMTNGATATLPRKVSRVNKKLSRRIPCTVGICRHATALASCFGYRSVRFTPTNLNRVICVPKSWKTDRTIACEPTGNIPFQLAFDTYVKSRLLQWRIDLSDQGKNQEMARLGSISGRFATIDLKNASDTVSEAVVALLLPELWYDYASRCRSRFYKLPDGSIGKYHKFSSMGNGCTFTIETLIFAAVIRECGVDPQDYAVYGDDLIIPTSALDRVLALLTFLGFTVNESKSFSTGSFRESCGKHYVHGIDVTPVFVRRLTTNPYPMDVALVINTLRVVSLPNGALWCKLKELYLSCKGEVPLIPFCWSNPTGGIWIDIQRSYAKKILRADRRNNLWVPQYKSLVSRPKIVRCSDSRTLFQWFLAKLREPLIEHESSTSSESSHKYEVKWICWVPSQQGLRDHFLTEWSEYLLAKAS